jgi:hypothetical protein
MTSVEGLLSLEAGKPASGTGGDRGLAKAVPGRPAAGRQLCPEDAA